jgi:hypothetical protein
MDHGQDFHIITQQIISTSREQPYSIETFWTAVSWKEGKCRLPKSEDIDNDNVETKTRTQKKIINKQTKKQQMRTIVQTTQYHK